MVVRSVDRAVEREGRLIAGSLSLGYGLLVDSPFTSAMTLAMDGPALDALTAAFHAA